MTDQSVFTASTPAPQEQQQTSQNFDAFANQLAAIKNENGQQKYANLDKALEALAHSQGYIPELKTEIQARDEIINTLKSELEKKQSMEELISRLANAQAPTQQPATPAQVAQGLDQNSVVDLVKKVLEDTNQAQSFKANVDKAQSVLLSKFGDKTTEVVAAKAKELGLTPQKIGELAGQSPAAVLAMFGLQTQQSGPSVTTGSVSIPGYKQPENPPLERPKKSLLSGATGKEQAAYMKQIRDDVYRKHGIEIPN